MRRSCTQWAEPSDICHDITAYDPLVVQEALLAAQEILEERTCFRFYVCPYEIRPCFCKCLSDCCCNYTPIKLGIEDPIIELVDVRFYDGTGTETIYVAPDVRIDNGKLVFTNGHVGFSQNLSANVGDPNTWVVNVIGGVVPPRLAARAVADLAWELLKSCNREDCELPNNVTSVTRDGITYRMADIGAGFFNIASTDLFVREFGCQTLTALYDPLDDTPQIFL